MRRLPLIILAFLSLMVSCSRGDRELAAGFLLADSLMEANPDSGLAYLQGLKGQAEKGSKAYRYRYQLLLAKAMNKAYVPFTSDSVMKDVAQYYDRHGSPNERMMAHYLLGCVYRDLDSLPQALLQYETAISQADTTREDCDFKTLGRIYGQAAGILWEFNQPIDLLEYARQSQRFARKAKDTAMIISTYEDMADAYNMLNKPDSQIILSQMAAQKYLDYGDKEGAAMALGSVIDKYVARKDWTKAKRSMDTYDRESGVFLPNGDIEPGREIYYFQKGQYYMGVSRLDSASYYFRKLQAKQNPSLNERTAVAQGLYNLYHEIGDKDSTLKYCEQAAILVDSALRLHMATGTTQVSSLYKYNKSQEEARHEELKAARFQFVLYLSLAILFLLLSIFLFVINRKNKRLWKERLRVKHHQDMLSQARESLTQAQEDMRMLKTRTEREKEFLVQRKQEQIDQLQEKIRQLDSPREEVESRICNAPITEKFHTLASQVKEMPTLQDWHELREMMNKELPNFYQTVNARTALQLDEYDICVLVRLRFKPKEIAFLANINSGYVSVIRKRLLLKVFGETGSASDFDREIQKIYR